MKALGALLLLGGGLWVRRGVLRAYQEKIRLGEDNAADPYIATVKRLVVSERLDFDTAKLLISEYKKARAQSDPEKKEKS